MMKSILTTLMCSLVIGPGTSKISIRGAADGAYGNHNKMLSTRPRKKPPRIGEIKDFGTFPGCGYFIRLKSAADQQARYVFLAESGAAVALMNLDGLDTKLRLVGPPRKGIELRLGAHTNLDYVAGAYRVRVETVLRNLPSEYGEDGDPWNEFDATITVANGPRRQRIKAVGLFGC